jgi:hypothetical protein
MSAAAGGQGAPPYGHGYPPGPSAPPPGPGAPYPGSHSGSSAATARARPNLARKLQLLERAGPWIVVTLLAGGALVGVMLLATAGDDPEPFRGHSGPALMMAVLCLATTVLAVFYSMRKRALQERLGGGTMTMWLWLHVSLGVLALLAAVLHAGWSAFTPTFSSGKLVFAIFVMLTGSGIVWRLAYRVVPPRAAPKIGNYSQVGSSVRAEQQLLEIEKLAAGRSPQFHELKAWVTAQEPPQDRFQHAVASLPDPADRAALAEVLGLAQSRRRALARHDMQARYTRLLSMWRYFHIPLTLLLLPALVIHIIGATYLPARLLPIGAVPFSGLSGFASSEDCKGCHLTIYEQWRTSMHAHALTSPVTIAQNNQVVRNELGRKPSPDPQMFCVNCHAPVAAAMVSDPKLPLERLDYSDALLSEGISCVVCHQYTGGSKPGSGGFSKYRDSLEPGPVMYGNLSKPVGNGYHENGTTPLHKQPQAMCQNCHNVHFDRNADGRVEKAVDLVLQSTDEEHQEYVAEGGTGTCITCHMPIVQGKRRAADDAIVPLEQDYDAPARVLHDHSFVGVDYPIDEVPKRDPHRDKRERLLRSAAKLDIEPGSVSAGGGSVGFRVSVKNVGAGHNLPTGFAFARQMWLEVTVTDGNGSVLGSSGQVSGSATDLCDANTLEDQGNPMTRFVQGCSAPDPQLVNFQAKLVDRTEPAKKNGELVRNEKGELVNAQPEGSEETWLQKLDGGVVARVRPSDKQVLTTIGPNDTRTFAYRIPLSRAGGGKTTLTVRLLFRNLPPYFLRALAANQPADEQPKLGPLIPNLQIVEMAVDRETLSGF